MQTILYTCFNTSVYAAFLITFSNKKELFPSPPLAFSRALPLLPISDDSEKVNVVKSPKLFAVAVARRRWPGRSRVGNLKKAFPKL